MSKHLYILMGKSATGKDTVFQELLKRESALKTVIPYTTRPIREGEQEGKEYHFVTEQQMHKMQEAGQIIELRQYHTVHGVWSYFTAEDGQVDLTKQDSIMISTLEGFAKLQAHYGKERVVALYLEIDDFTRMERSLNREKQQKEPCVAECCRRYLADEEDFSKEHLEQLGITEGICNLDLESAICQIQERMKNI